MESKKAIVTVIILVITTLKSFGSFGFIEGTITDKKTGETLIGATVVLNGSTIGTTSDINGNFILPNLKPGIYTLTVSYVSYDPKVIDGVKINENQPTILRIDMESVEHQINEVVVFGSKKTNTEVSMINSIKSSQLVVSGISSQQIGKSLDKDASDAIKRIPGITIMDEKFVVVRGLSQRYNNVWLNNAATPSSEADQKAFSFDVIPTNMVDNILIYKNNSPDLPADFAGGFIKITTKNMPDENSMTFSYTTAFNEGTTFNKFIYFDGGKTDWLGFDDGTRRLPSGFPSNFEAMSNQEKESWAKKLNQNWTPKYRTAAPDQRINLGINRRFDIGSVKVGTINNVSYSYGFDKVNDLRQNEYLSYDAIANKPDSLFAFTDNQYTNKIKLGGMSNWTFIIDANNRIEFRNLFNHITSIKSFERSGWDYNNTFYIKSYGNRFQERSTYSGQIAGEHTIAEKNRLNWYFGYSFANKNEPDIKQIQSTRNDVEGDARYGQYAISINAFVDPNRAGRLFLDLSERLFSGATNYERPLAISGYNFTLKSGIYVEGKTRDFNARLFGYKRSPMFNNDLVYLPTGELFTNINSQTGLILGESVDKSNSYSASNMLSAGYLQFNLPIGTKISLLTGVRVENNIQQLDGYNKQQQKENVDNNNTNLFPSLNLTYNLTEKSVVRLGYGEAINRPEFREIASFHFFDFDENKSYEGSPKLKDAKITSIDLRYEFYPTSSESISAGLFYKQFINPIELKYENQGGGSVAYTFQNAKKAQNYGAEVEIRKSLDFFEPLKNFTTVFNASYIFSKVNFAEGTIERNRPMQGQSPYIVNAGIFYSSEKSKISASLLYNIIGRRIVAVGEPKQNIIDDIPDTYEESRNQLDFSISKKMSKGFEIKVGIKDILNEEVRYTQTVELGNGSSKTSSQTIKSFTPGREFILGFQLNF